MQASKLGLSTRRGQLIETENGNMITNDEIMMTSGKNDGNCLSSSVTTIEESNTSSNKNEQQEHPHQQNKPTLGATSAPNNTSRSQVSSDNENSSDHSATWSTSHQSASKKSAQKRLEAAQKLNLILPQQQQQQQQQQQLLHLQPQQKNCLSTPIVITSDDLHLVPSQHQHQQQQQAYGQFYQSQQMLFDSLAHQLNNQGGDVSLFTGLPSCTPASADRLTASGINPFFLQAAAAPTTINNYPANGELAPNGDAQMRHSWPDQNNAAQQVQDQGGAVNKHSLPSNGYAASNLSSSNSNNNNNNHNHLDQRTKLTIADLQAASALSPIILSPLSFLGLSPEQEALLRYGYVSPSQHPLAGRAFTQADLNQLNHQHQVYHLNQMYHGQRAEPINTHHYTLDHHQQQMNQHHHQHHQQTPQHPHQQHNQQAFEHHQQQHNQVAKDLTQQASVASQQAVCTTAAAAATTATRTNTTGHIYTPNGTHTQQIPLGSTTAGHLAHHNNPHQQPGLNRVQAQQQQMPAQPRHFVTIAESSQREHRPHSIVARPLSQGANCQQQGPPTNTTQATPVAGKYASRLVEAYPVAPIREQLAKPQLVMASQQHPGPQQSGLILMPGDRVLTTNGRPSSSSSMAAGGGPRIAQAERPAIILYEPPSSSPSRPIYDQLEQTKDSRSKTPKHSTVATYSSTSDPNSRSDIVQAATTTTGKTTNEQVASSSGPETCSTTTTTLSGLSCSPPRRSAIDRAEKPINSSDNLVSDHQSMDGKGLQENISSNNDKMKPKQKKTTKKAVQLAAPATTITTTNIQDQGSQEVPVKKKSRGGRKKKQVTHDELMARKNRSKERNRVAARRCRQKRKQFLDELRDKIDHLHELNQSLRSENSMLKGELETIKRHHSACNI